MQLFAGLMERNGNRGSLNICSRARAYMAFLTEQIELQAKLLNYFLGSNKSNINQSLTMWCIACESEWCCLSLVYLLWRVITRIVRGNCIGNTWYHSIARESRRPRARTCAQISGRRAVHNVHECMNMYGQGLFTRKACQARVISMYTCVLSISTTWYVRTCVQDWQVVWRGKQVYVADYVAIAYNELQKMIQSMKAQALWDADMYRNQ